MLNIRTLVSFRKVTATRLSWLRIEAALMEDKGGGFPGFFEGGEKKYHSWSPW